MRFLIASATALIAFSKVALFGGKIVPGGVSVARAIAASFGLYI
jgi:hypothetical protein